MIFFAGLMSFLQVFFLPGLLLQCLFQIYFKKYDGKNHLNLILLVPGSLFINFVLSCFLVIFQKNVSTSWWFIFFLEIALIVFLSFRRKNSFLNHFEDDKSSQGKNFSFSPSWLLFSISLVFTLVGFFNYLGSWGKIFSDWDAVVSWNRWALDFAHGSWPSLTFRYPQLVPSFLSIPYLFMNEASVPFFPYSNVNFIEFLCYISLFIFAWKNKNSLPLILIIFVSYFPRKMMTIHSGGADMPLFYFSLIALCSLHTLYLNKDAEWALIIGTFSVLAAAETKQGGVLLALFFILYVWYLRRSFPLKSALLIATTVILTNTWEEYRVYKGISVSADLASANAKDVFERLMVALHNLHKNLWLFRIPSGVAYIWQLFLLALLLGGLILSKPARLFIIFALFFTPIWALVTSYDTRNLAVALPFYLFAMAIPLQVFIFDKLPSLKSSFFNHSFFFLIQKNYKFILMSIFSIFIVLGAGGGFYFSNDKIKNSAKQLWNKLGDPDISRALHEYFDKYPFQKDELILNHRYLYLPYIPRFSPYVMEANPYAPLSQERIMEKNIRLLVSWYPGAEKSLLYSMEKAGKIKRLGSWDNDNIFIFEVVRLKKDQKDPKDK